MLFATMNTLRFFLLLVSIFFFAFLFQTNTFLKKDQDKEVLSGNTVSTAMVTPFSDSDGQAKTAFIKYFYPGSKIFLRQNEKMILASREDISKIIVWYANTVGITPQIEQSVPAKEKTYILADGDKQGKVTVRIAQKENNDLVFITISVTAP